MVNEFNFSSAIKRKVFTLIGIGLVLALIGVIGLKSGWRNSHHEGGHGHEVVANDAGHDAHGAEAHADAQGEDHGGGHHDHWYKRIIAALWHNAIFFTGVSLLGVFFLAIQYVTWAGWSAAISRVFLSFGFYLPIGGVITIVLSAKLTAI